VEYQKKRGTQNEHGGHADRKERAEYSRERERERERQSVCATLGPLTIIQSSRRYYPPCPFRTQIRKIGYHSLIDYCLMLTKEIGSRDIVISKKALDYLFESTIFLSVGSHPPMLPYHVHICQCFMRLEKDYLSHHLKVGHFRSV
jgi:hypothetical protein